MGSGGIKFGWGGGDDDDEEEEVRKEWREELRQEQKGGITGVSPKLIDLHLVIVGFVFPVKSF